MDKSACEGKKGELMVIFYSLRRLGVFLICTITWMGCQSITRLPPTVCCRYTFILKRENVGQSYSAYGNSMTARLGPRLPYLVGHHASTNEHGSCKICTQHHTSIMHKCFKSIQCNWFYYSSNSGLPCC